MEYLTAEEMEAIRLVSDKSPESIATLAGRAKAIEEQLKEMIRQKTVLREDAA